MKIKNYIKRQDSKKRTTRQTKNKSFRSESILEEYPEAKIEDVKRAFNELAEEKFGEIEHDKFTII